MTVTLFEGFRKADLLAYLASVAEGQERADPRVVSYRAARVEVISPHGLPAHADGDSVGALATPFEALPGAVTVIAPPVEQRSTMKWSITAPLVAPAPPPPRPVNQTLRWQVARPTDAGGEGGAGVEDADRTGD